MSNKHSPRGRLRPFILGAAVVVLLAGLCAAVLGASYRRQIQLPQAIQTKIDLLPDVSAQAGTPQADQVSQPLESENFRVVINQMLTMETGESPCNILAENPAENPYDLRICLYLKDTGELLGATHRIQRGQRVDEITLDRVLPAGEYQVTARLELFDDEQQAVEQIALELSLLVRG